MESIIFDLDGTLWDSRETVLVAWNQLISQHPELEKELTMDNFKQTMGLQIDEIGKKLFPSLHEEQRKTLLKACCDLECDFLRKSGGNLYEGVERTLEQLAQNFKLFIVSNCQEGYIEAFYDYHKLGRFFQDYENPGRTGLSKGENIKLIMERNHLSSPIYVGDTEGDQKAAAFADIPFVFARYGFGNPGQWDAVIDKFDQLLEKVQGF